MKWILIFVYAGWNIGSDNNDIRRSVEVTGIEFNTLDACQFASVEIGKRTQFGQMVCVPKGDK